ncbi:MAG: transcriptional coactivator p15/PC4 family protein [Planctomycetota bacterium]
MADLEKVGELEKNASTKIVFSTTEYKGEPYVDVREYVETATYTGFTKKGIRLHYSKLDEFVENLEKVKAGLSGSEGTSADG